jgi:predicted N-acetyltransferase YhbS
MQSVNISAINIQFLADCPKVIPAIACLHQLEMKLGKRSNYCRTLEQFRLRINRDSLPLTLVAFVDTLPVASASLVSCDLDSHQHLEPWLASLFVATPYQNQGIGSRLSQEIESIAVNKGYRKLYLYTWTGVEFYRKLGWIFIDTAQPEGFPKSIVMQKTL